MIEDGGVKFFFGGEVPENHRLGNTRRLGNFLGGGAAKASIGEETDGHGEDLEPPLFSGHAGAASRAFNCHLLTQDLFIPFST